MGKNGENRNPERQPVTKLDRQSSVQARQPTDVAGEHRSICTIPDLILQSRERQRDGEREQGEETQ